jgi:hypothetical protein
VTIASAYKKIFYKLELRIKIVQSTNLAFITLQLMCETFLILTGIQRDTVMNIIRCSCKVTVIFSDFNLP